MKLAYVKICTFLRKFLPSFARLLDALSRFFVFRIYGMVLVYLIQYMIPDSYFKGIKFREINSARMQPETF